MVASTALPGVHMPDEEFRAALLWRLGVRGVPCRCRNRPVAGGAACDERVDGDADHAFLCALGPVRGATHRQYGEFFCEVLEECGAVARREAYVPEFRNSKKADQAAYLDVWGFGHVELADVLIDVTHRHPMKRDSQPAAARVPGHCCKQAASDKERTYPAAAGRKVLTACVEAWGRLSTEAESFLVHAAAVAARNDRRRGRDPAGRLASWRARLDAISQRSAALALRCCRQGLPGTAPARTSRKDLCWATLRAHTQPSP